MSRSSRDKGSAQGILEEVSVDVSISEIHYKLACAHTVFVQSLKARMTGVDKPGVCIRKNARLGSHPVGTKDKLWHQDSQSRHKS